MNFSYQLDEIFCRQACQHFEAQKLAELTHGQAGSIVKFMQDWAQDLTSEKPDLQLVTERREPYYAIAYQLFRCGQTLEASDYVKTFSEDG